MTEMDEQALIEAEERERDEEHLRLLSIFHYVLAGLATLAAFFPGIYLLMGIWMILGGFGPAGNRAEIEKTGWYMVIIAGGLVLLALIYAVMTALAGRFLALRRNRLYCLVMAAFTCLLFPIGTLLGIFTLVVLGRPKVNRLFAASRESR